MRNQMLLALLSVSSILTAYSSPADARPWYRTVNHRQHNQQYRIAQGVSNGSLTTREAVRLEARESQLRSLEARLRLGGLSRSERSRLERELNQLNNSIYSQKHDCQHR
jgi:hypothetical protein